MGIKVKESSMIYPAEDTPKTRIWLTSIDLYRSSMSSNVHTPLICVYPNANKSNDFMNTSILKKALSRVLVPFYPAAGRLRKQDDGRRLEIDCNGAGALFIEIETTHELSDFGDFTPNDELRKVVCATYDMSKELLEVPLVIVQLTRFKCGGVCLEFVIDHQIADAVSKTHLMTSWARLARNLDLSLLPTLDRSCLAPRHPPLIQFDHSEYDANIAALPSPSLGLSGETAAVTECMFELSKSQINTLKEEAIKQSKLSYKLSTFEVLAAHVWRCSCKARGLTHDQDVKLYMPINGRGRLKKPSIPEGYFGNVVFYSSSCPWKAGDIIEKPLWEVANMIHQAIKKVDDDEYLRSAVDYLETLTGPKSVTHGSRSLCPDLIINSLHLVPFNEIDFGWGPPNIVRHGGIRNEGQAFIFPNIGKDGGMALVIKLFTRHMPLFRTCLFEFGAPKKPELAPTVSRL